MATQAASIIPVSTDIIDYQPVHLVDARELHGFLSIDARFNDWISRRITEYGFEEDSDFYSKLSKRSKGRPSREYRLTLDMAKELSMVERNEKGKQARRYFIECEKQLHAVAPEVAHRIADDTIGTDGLKVLRELISKKVRVLPHTARNSAQQRLWNLLHTRFNVPKAEMIAANDFDAAANFVGQWAIEGEYLERARPPAETMVINFPKRQKALNFTPTGLYGNEAWKNDLSLLMVELRHAARNGNTLRVENVEGPLEEMLALRHFLEIAEGGLSPRNRQLLAGKANALECAFVQQVGPALKLLDSKLYGDMRQHIGTLARYLRQDSCLSA